jgi:hypothetical protein
MKFFTNIFIHIRLYYKVRNNNPTTHNMSSFAEIIMSAVKESMSGLSAHLAENLTADDLSVETIQTHIDSFVETTAAPASAKKVQGKLAAKKTSKVAKKAAKKTTKKELAEVNPDDVGEIIVCLNYGPKSHALFGETKLIKDHLMTLNSPGDKLVSYNGKLAFGAGWTITDKERLSEVTDFLTTLGITYREIEKADYKKEVEGSEESETPKKTAKKTVAKKTVAKKTVAKKTPAKTKKVEEEEEEAEAEEEETPKKAPAKKAPAKTASTALSTVKTQKNSCDNEEEADTGIVFLQLPVGVNGRNVPVAVGVQNVESEEKGLASVNPLAEELVAECEEKKWRTLTDEMMATLKTKKHPKFAELTEMRARSSSSEEEPAEEEDAE